MSKDLKEKQAHIDFILAKSLRTQKRWNKIMQSKGSLSDLEESTPVKSNTETSKNTKNTKNIPTTNQNIQRKQRTEKFLNEVFD